MLFWCRGLFANKLIHQMDLDTLMMMAVCAGKACGIMNEFSSACQEQGVVTVEMFMCSAVYAGYGVLLPAPYLLVMHNPSCELESVHTT